jgi:hypothetical protein
MSIKPILICFAALALAGCNTVGMAGLSGDKVARPKTVLVTDFVADGDVVMIDRGFTARLERKIGAYPTFERKLRTAERVNDEIVATIVASLRDAGLPAQPGSAEGLTASDDAVVVKARLHAPGAADKAKADSIGIGTGRGGVSADVTLSRISSFGSRQLLAFSTGPQGKGGKSDTARNASIATALTDTKAAPERLSPDVEAQARRIGRAVADKIIAYAREQNWFAAPEADGEAAEPAPAAKPKPSTAPVS